MPAPDWDEHQAEESSAPIEVRVDDDDPIAPSLSLAEEPEPFDTMLSEGERDFASAETDPAEVDARSLSTAPGIGPAKPSKILHTNPHASPPPPLLGAPCAGCGTINPPQAQFCARCGLTVGEHVSQAMASAPISAAPLIMPAQLGGPPVAKTMMADAPGPIAQSAMSGVAHSVPSAMSGPVSPYAATVEQRVYQPGDPLHSNEASSPKLSQPKYPPMPESSRPSILPILLIVVGVAVLLAVILIWFLG